LAAEQAMVAPSELTTLGKIGAAHGIRGWVRLISFTDPADNILDFRHFYLSPAVGSAAVGLERIEIDESRSQGKHFVGHIKGCDDRDLASKFTGRELLVEKSALPALEDDGFYWFQLEGLQVINLQNDSLGQVDHLIETGANDVLVVRPTPDSIDTVERLIPYIQDQVIKQVDLDTTTIRVDWEKDY
jgi:16S rRNA processing protein RimM